MADNWRKDIGACVLNGLGECLANAPVACICEKMPRRVYEEYLEQLAPSRIADDRERGQDQHDK